MRNPDLLFIMMRSTSACEMRKAIGIIADVIHIDSVPHYGSKRRYNRIFIQYPDEPWLDLRGFYGSEIDGFQQKYIAEIHTWLLPGGTVTFL